MIAYLWWFVFIISWNVFDRGARTVAKAGARSERLHSLVLAFGIVTLVLAPVTRDAGRMWTSPILDLFGLLSMAAGTAFCWWARRHLGRFWSAEVTRKEAHRVVDTGPYRFVRHPIYTGFIMIYAGMAIICASPMGVLAFAMMALGLWLKARVEEQFLMEELGIAAYGSYRARTPMLMPRLRL